MKRGPNFPQNSCIYTNKTANSPKQTKVGSKGCRSFDDSHRTHGRRHSFPLDLAHFLAGEHALSKRPQHTSHRPATNRKGPLLGVSTGLRPATTPAIACTKPPSWPPSARVSVSGRLNRRTTRKAGHPDAAHVALQGLAGIGQQAGQDLALMPHFCFLPGPGGRFDSGRQF